MSREDVFYTTTWWCFIADDPELNPWLVDFTLTSQAIRIFIRVLHDICDGLNQVL